MPFLQQIVPYLQFIHNHTIFWNTFISSNLKPIKTTVLTAFFAMLLSISLNAQTPFFYEDFASGFNSPNGYWTTDGLQQWKYSFTGTSGQFSSGIPQPQFTTAANGYMIIDADSINVPYSPNYIDFQAGLISPTIDMSPYSEVFIEFESYFRTNDDSVLILYISNDNGTTWNAPTYCHFNIPIDTLSPNPMVVQVDITPFAASFSACKAKFEWAGASHYFWGVDGVGFYNQAPPNPWTNVTENGQSKSDFSFYPNPACDQLTIEFFNQENQNYALEITDVSGKTIFIEKGKATGSAQKTILDISILPAGSYFVKYTDNNYMRFKKLQITR